MEMKMLCLLAFLVATTAAQQAPQAPQPCCASHRFSAVIGQTGGYVQNGNEVPIDGFMELLFDYDAKLMSMELHTLNLTSGQYDNTSILMDYNTHKQYFRTQDYGCFEDSMDDAMVEPCVPDSATYMARVTLGSGDSTLDTDVWQFTTPGTDNVVKMVVTADTCTPVMQSTYGTMYGGPRSETLIFTNFQGAITDRSSLVVPQNCQPVPAQNQNPLVGRRSIVFN